MKAVSQSMQDHLDGAVTTLCSCWKVTREDGRILGFTDHDADIDFEGETYIASSGFFRSAISTTATTSVDNLEVKGFLDDDTISEADLINGMYDYADVEIFMLNWTSLGDGPIRMRYGKFGEVTRWPSGLFVVELRGLLQQFEQVVGQIFTPECRADLGDKRCKFNLFVPIRQSGKFYPLGARVRIPFLANLATVALPIANHDFEEVETQPLLPWMQADGNFPILFTNRSVIPAEGEFVAQPVKQSGELMQTVYRGNIEADPNGPSDTNLNVRAYRLTASAYVPEDGWKLQVYHQQLSAVGDVLSNTMLTEFAFQGGDYQTAQMMFGNGFSINGSDKFRIRFRWLPKAGAGTTQNPILLDWTKLEYTESPGWTPVVIPGNTVEWVELSGGAWFMPGFELGSLAINNGPHVFGWNSQFAYTRRTANTELVPDTGNAYAVTSGMQLPGFMDQIVPLVPAYSPVTTDLIDAGQTVLEVTAPISTEVQGFIGKMSLLFYNASAAYIAGKDAESQWIRPDLGGWLPVTVKTKVPPGARYVGIRLWADDTPQAQTTTARIAWDNVQAQLSESDAGVLDYTAFGGLEFVVTNPGITDMPVPAFSGVAGAALIDGGVVWQASTPAHAFLCTVTEVTNHATFKATGCPQETNWVQFGVVTWLTGLNTGRKIECSHFTAPDQFETILPQPHRPAIGDKFMVHTGCDKGRLTCNHKFNNILNFRGEPDIPGTGQYFKVGAP